MKKKLLVSTIMIFLNAEVFIQEAIESVLAQTYPDWELILVDDGSSDGSTGIARRYAEGYPQKIRYFEHDGHANLGMSASRNRGIHEARGEFIAFLDSDDVYLPQKLEKQVEILRSHPQAAMVYGATRYWYSWTGKAEDLQRDHPRRLGLAPDQIVEPPQLPILFLKNLAQTPATCSVLIRRQAIEQVGGFEEQFRGMFEDQAFFFKLCLRFPVFVESGQWDLYRQHSQSAVSVSLKTGEFARHKLNPSHRAFYNWLESYLAQQAISDPELCKALARNLKPYRYPYRYHLESGLFRFSRWFRRRSAE